MKPLFVPLKTEYFNEFKSGIKVTEFRLYGARWNDGTIIPGREVTLSHGYSGERIKAEVIKMRKTKNKKKNSIYPFDAVLAAIDLKVFL